MIASIKRFFANLFKSDAPAVEMIEDVWYPSSPKADAAAAVPTKEYNPASIQEDFYFGSPDTKSKVEIAPDLVKAPVPEVSVAPVKAPAKPKAKPQPKKAATKAPAKVQKPAVKAPAPAKAPAKQVKKSAAPAPAKKAAPKRSVKK